MSVYYRPRALAIAGVAALSLTACGSDTSSSAGTTAPAPVDTAAETSATDAAPAAAAEAPQDAAAPSDAAAPPSATPAPQPVSLEGVSTDPDVLKRGRIVFLRCRSCHSLKQGEAHKVGPNLYQIMNAASGMKDGFNYSSALAEGAVTWTPEALDAFILKPTDYTPGTRMVFVGLRSETDRQAVISYLAAETQ